MSRARLFETVQNSQGQPVVGASVAVYNPGTTTPISETIYADDTGGTTVANPLTTGADGSVIAYLDVPRRVDLLITAGGQSPRTVPDVGVEPDPSLGHASGSAVGVTSSPTTTSTTYVDLTDMSVTVTLSSGVLIATFHGTFIESAAGAYMLVAFSLDAAAEVGAQFFIAPTASFVTELGLVYRWSGLSAGSHTVKVRWAVASGTGTANGTNRSLVLMEG